MGRHRRILDDAASAFPNARPAMKLERISAAAQTELPNAKPLSRNQSVSKIRAPVPERKRTPQRTATRVLCDPTTWDVCLARDTCDFCELVNIAQRSARPQQHSREPAIMPRLAASTKSVSLNASMAMNSDM